jgi:hypothetical protein
MNRFLAGSLVAAGVAVALSACNDGLSGYYAAPAADCSAYTRCGTCTPVVGCGWCAGPGGSGVCVSDPDYCPTQQFTWTWDPNGCLVVADASVGPTEDVSVAPAEDVSVGSPDAASNADAPKQDSAPAADAPREAARRDASGS